MILAAMVIAKNPVRYGFDVIPEAPLSYEKVMLRNPVDLRRVAEWAGAELVVDTAVGRLRAVPSGPVVDRCVLAIRPENVAISDGTAANGGNIVRGRVSFAAYLGSALRYDVEAGQGQILKADIRDPWHHEPLPIGSEVAASFPASVALAVCDDA